MASSELMRTSLYAGGTSPVKMIQAGFYNEDCIVYDLEDSVSAGEKDAARFLVYNLVKYQRPKNKYVVVRVNGLYSEYLDEELVLPSETVMDYASALFTGTAPLSPIPEALSDRIRYDGKLDSYLLTCGDDSLAEIQLTSIRELGGSLSVDGSLVYLVDGSSLAQFHAQFARQDNMFGYVITNLTLG